MGVPYLEIKCPHCGRSFEWRLLYLCSGLGPAKLECAKCHQVAASDRVEWDAMFPIQRVRYLSLTGLYMLVIGWLGGVGIRLVVHSWENGPWADKVQEMFGTGFVEGAVGWALLVAGLQAYRVVDSTRRTRAERPTRVVTTFWSIHCDLQLKVAAGPWIPAALGWMFAFLRSKLG